MNRCRADPAGPSGSDLARWAAKAAEFGGGETRGGGEEVEPVGGPGCCDGEVGKGDGLFWSQHRRWPPSPRLPQAEDEGSANAEFALGEEEEGVKGGWAAVM